MALVFHIFVTFIFPIPAQDLLATWSPSLFRKDSNACFNASWKSWQAIREFQSVFGWSIFEVFGIVCPQVTPKSMVLTNRHWANPYTGVGLVLNHQYFEPNSPCFIIFLDLYANTKFFTSSPHVSWLLTSPRSFNKIPEAAVAQWLVGS